MAWLLIPFLWYWHCSSAKGNLVTPVDSSNILPVLKHIFPASVSRRNLIPSFGSEWPLPLFYQFWSCDIQHLLLLEPLITPLCLGEVVGNVGKYTENGSKQIQAATGSHSAAPIFLRWNFKKYCYKWCIKSRELWALCYELNVFVPPKSPHWNLIPNVMVLGGGTLKGY